MRLLCFILAAASTTYGVGLEPWQDPEVNMTTDQMARYWGYKDANLVQVTTEDGYILGVHHIPYGRNGTGNDGKPRPVVFLQHGLEAASDCFAWDLPNESLAYIFADQGFDVWLGNVRGNNYSLGHVSLSTKDPKFWEFSWDEMAKYDLDAMINYVLKVTGADGLYYVGHSQDKGYFALAPIGTVKHIKGMLAFLANELYAESEVLLDILGNSEFLPKSWVMDLVGEYVCGENKQESEECENLFWLICGPNTNQANETRMPVYLGHAPAGTSTRNIIHWLQNVRSGKHQAYNYGDPHLNWDHYGMGDPPIYNVSLVNAPTYLYWSDEDWLGDPQDVTDYLLKYLRPEILKGNFHFDNFNHLDFVLGMRAAKEIYHPMAQIIIKDFYGN